VHNALSVGVNGAAAMPDPDRQNSMAHIMPVTIHACFWYLHCHGWTHVLAQIITPILTLF